MTIELTETLRRQIGQHFVFGFHGYEVSKDIRTLITDYYIGSIIIMKRNIRDAIQIRKIITELQLLAKNAGHPQPLLIGIDQENGLVSAFSSDSSGTQLSAYRPGAMALAATGSPELASEITEACAKELKLVGFNWAYSPVADVNSDPRNPVIGVRSFGDGQHILTLQAEIIDAVEDPTRVFQYAAAVGRGLVKEGIAPCAKHFPGHGDTDIDSHLGLPIIVKSREELERVELLPFRNLLIDERSMPSVMIGHIALPALTGDNSPASVSKLIGRGLLRGDMDYRGLVVTDCLEMDAVADTAHGACGVEEGAVRALASGVDVVMACHTFKTQVAAVEQVYEAVKNGTVSLEELMESTRRVSKFKAKFAKGWDSVLDDAAFDREWAELKAKNLELASKAYRRSCTVIWGSHHLPLRLQASDKILLFTPVVEAINPAVDDDKDVMRDREGRVMNRAGASYLALEAAIAERQTRVEHIVYVAQEDAGAHIRSKDRVKGVVFVLRNADKRTWQRAKLEQVLEAVRETGALVIIVASCGPYDLDGMKVQSESSVFVATFEYTKLALEGLAWVLFEGGGGGGGQVPVRLGV